MLAREGTTKLAGVDSCRVGMVKGYNRGDVASG
jgi:hypothetical protein